MFFSRSSRKRGAAHPRFLVLRRRWLGLAAAGLAAAAIFAAVNYPAAVSASAAARQLPIYCVQRDQKVCAISFDAAWGADNTQKILDVLQEYGVTATFFVVGNWADQYPAQAKAIAGSGCELMNHSNAHDHYNALSADEIIADVNLCNDKIEALTGVRPTLIRCPFGEYDDHVISAIRSIGMEPIQWDVEACAAVGTGGNGRQFLWDFVRSLACNFPLPVLCYFQIIGVVSGHARFLLLWEKKFSGGCRFNI